MEEKKLPHDHGQSMERELEQMPSVDDFQTVADIFKQLGAGGLIVSRRDGKEVYYKAAETERAQLLHHMIEAMVEIACPSA